MSKEKSMLDMMRKEKSILDMPWIHEQVADKSLLENPIYVGLAHAMDKMRATVYKDRLYELYPILMLESSEVIEDPQNQTYVDVRHNGKTVFQQGIELIFELQYMYKDAVEGHGVDFDPMPFLESSQDRYNTKAMMGLLNLSCYNAGCISSQLVMQFLSMMLPIPTSGCEYFKLSRKAQDYVMSLGLPSKDVLVDFYNSLAKKAECCGGFYDALIQFSLNGRITYVYYGFSNQGFFAFRYGSNKADQEFCYDYAYIMRDFEVNFSETVSGDEVFEIRALLANIWASELTNNMVRTSEPSENRRYIDQTMSGRKTNYMSYSYVKITPECETEFEESKRIISSAKKDAEYRKAVWYTRAYYAKRGAEKKIVLCKASIHHRKCAELSDKPVVQVYV